MTREGDRVRTGIACSGSIFKECDMLSCIPKKKEDKESHEKKVDSSECMGPSEISGDCSLPIEAEESKVRIRKGGSPSYQHWPFSQWGIDIVSPLPTTPGGIMDDPNITMEEYIRLQEEKAQRAGRTFNWQTAIYGKVKYYEDEDDCFTNFESEFPAIVFDDTSDATLSCEPTVSPLNDNKVDFRKSFDESDDEDYTEQYGDHAETMIWYSSEKDFVLNSSSITEA
ncbi:hypothetical protein Tco_0339322 [Tanacetum coccineum]